MGHGDCYEVICPQNAEEFCAAWDEAGPCIIMHTHGSAQSLCNQLEDGSVVNLITLDQLKEMPRSKTIRLVVVTACETAGGDPLDNVASVLSQKISPRGLVIANVYPVWGADTYFGEKHERNGWTVYQDGEIIRHPDELPVTITLDYACKLFLNMP